MSNYHSLHFGSTTPAAHGLPAPTFHLGAHRQQQHHHHHHGTSAVPCASPPGIRPRSVMLMASDFRPLVISHRSLQVLSYTEAEELSRTVLLANMPSPQFSGPRDSDAHEVTIIKFYYKWLSEYGTVKKVEPCDPPGSLICTFTHRDAALRAVTAMHQSCPVVAGSGGGARDAQVLASLASSRRKLHSVDGRQFYSYDSMLPFTTANGMASDKRVSIAVCIKNIPPTSTRSEVCAVIGYFARSAYVPPEAQPRGKVICYFRCAGEAYLVMAAINYACKDGPLYLAEETYRNFVPRSWITAGVSACKVRGDFVGRTRKQLPSVAPLLSTARDPSKALGILLGMTRQRLEEDTIPASGRNRRASGNRGASESSASGHGNARCPPSSARSTPRSSAPLLVPPAAFQDPIGNCLAFNPFALHALRKAYELLLASWYSTGPLILPKPDTGPHYSRTPVRHHDHHHEPAHVLEQESASDRLLLLRRQGLHPL